MNQPLARHHETTRGDSLPTGEGFEVHGQRSNRPNDTDVQQSNALFSIFLGSAKLKFRNPTKSGHDAASQRCPNKFWHS